MGSANGLRMRVLILDANQRAALAATRSLGRAGLEAITADVTERSLAGASRYAVQHAVYPSPRAEPEAFLAWFQRSISDLRLDAALPIAEVTTDLVVRNRSRWPSLLLPFASIEQIDALSDKVALYERALELGVRVPKSVAVRNPSDLERAVTEIGLPAILKPCRSWLRIDNRFVPTSVARAASASELQELLVREEFRRAPFLYQEEIRGKGIGVFALYRHGEAVAFFSHRRLREKPPDGGVSVLSESCAPDPTVLQSAKRLLNDARWHGVAMVEFKGESGSEPYLMEVNARFWGSLQLAIDAGVDFPKLLLEGVARETPSEARRYVEGRRLRWFLGDADRIYLLAKGIGKYGVSRTLRELLAFCMPDPFRVRHETFRWSDPLPALAELRQYVSAARSAGPR